MPKYAVVQANRVRPRTAIRLHQRTETHVTVHEVCRWCEPPTSGDILLSEPLDEMSDNPARAA